MPVDRLASDAGGGPSTSAQMADRRSQARAVSPATRIHALAARGTSGPGVDLPHRDQIEESFGRHGLNGVRAHVGSDAGDSTIAMGARAYAVGDQIAFDGTPDLHTAAHEAAHVVQQRRGVSLDDGVGRPGDVYEQQADTVADRVVRGESAEELLDEAGSGSTGAIQLAPAEGSVQMDILDDARETVGRAWDAAGEAAGQARDAVSEGIDYIRRQIDLLGPKNNLLSKMRDGEWIVGAVGKAMEADAHPDHQMMLNLRLVGVGAEAGAEIFGFMVRIQNCDDLESVESLEAEFDEWRSAREESLAQQLEEVVETYRETERGWLEAFGNAGEIERDPANPNQSAQNVRLAFAPGVPQSTATVETRVTCNFQRTANAMQDADGDGNPDVPDWSDDEKEHFMSRFQQQLDDVWSTGAGDVDPFRLAQPPDHLLADESPKWSDVTATMQARVTQDDDNPHFTLSVFKKAPTENPRDFVGQNSGTFYLESADAGYDAAGDPTGDQHTLAHEWHHMIGNPDEYSESSQAQSGASTTPADRQGDWNTCQTHFNNIISDPDSTDDEKQKAQEDLTAIRRHATDTDPAEGFQAGIFDVANRPDIPDECFAIRGTWEEGPDQRRLRPGAQSQRGGTNISQSAEDAARLSDRGNQVRPYMREGIVEVLQSMLQGAFRPEVRFDHNFKDLTTRENVEIVQTRIQNQLRDSQVPMGTSSAPADEVGHDHDHDH